MPVDNDRHFISVLGNAEYVFCTKMAVIGSFAGEWVRFFNRIMAEPFSDRSSCVYYTAILVCLEE